MCGGLNKFIKVSMGVLFISFSFKRHFNFLNFNSFIHGYRPFPLKLGFIHGSYKSKFQNFELFHRVRQIHRFLTLFGKLELKTRITLLMIPFFIRYPHMVKFARTSSSRQVTKFLYIWFTSCPCISTDASKKQVVVCTTESASIKVKIYHSWNH